MKKLFLFLSVIHCALSLHGQNLTTVSASNITDINGARLAAGQLCFLGTDQSDNPISFQIGGGGQALRRGYCSPVAAGVVTSFTVPTPTATLPSGIYYRVTVKDASTGQEVLRYSGVTFAGATFNFDNYAPVNLGSLAPLTGTSVSGNLGVTGNIVATGTVTGSNIPGNILQQIFSAGTGLTQRTAFNCLAGVVCSDNASASRTDLRLGSLTTVTFSVAPTFDASTASTFKLTLTGNVTSSTLSNAVAGEPINIEICQDAIGGRTFVPPTNVQGWVAIPSGANACILQDMVYDGTNAVASSAGTVEFASPPPIGSTTPNSVAATTLSATGTSTLANVNLGSSNILTAASIRAIALNFFGISDALGAQHFGLSNASPYTNTFISGNGNGSVFLGSAAKTSVADTTGVITMSGATSGTTSIQPSAVAGSTTLTLPAATDTLVGKTTTDTLTNKTLTSPAITSPTINTGVSQGSGLKHQRFGATCTTGATAGNTCTTAYTWTSAFSDANYTVTCWGSAATGTNATLVENTAHTASTVTIVLQTNFNVASSYGVVDCIAVHD